MASVSTLPTPGTEYTRSVMIAPVSAASTAAGIPCTIGIAAFLKMCFVNISFSVRPPLLAN